MKEGESPLWRFCALEYRQRSGPLGSSGARNEAAPVIVIAQLDLEGRLKVLVHPALPSVVELEDEDYLQSLFKDFKERALLHPASLFKQLCSLGGGPLVTRSGGQDIEDNPELAALRATFVQL
jgi:hypothetical protein